jgi:hypothetical protein
LDAAVGISYFCEAFLLPIESAGIISTSQRTFSWKTRLILIGLRTGVGDACCPTGDSDHLLSIFRKDGRTAIAAVAMTGAACRIKKFENEKNAGVNSEKSIPDENKTPPGWRWGADLPFARLSSHPAGDGGAQ